MLSMLVTLVRLPALLQQWQLHEFAMLPYLRGVHTASLQLWFMWHRSNSEAQLLKHVMQKSITTIWCHWSATAPGDWWKLLPSYTKTCYHISIHGIDTGTAIPQVHTKDHNQTSCLHNYYWQILKQTIHHWFQMVCEAIWDNFWSTQI